MRTVFTACVAFVSCAPFSGCDSSINVNRLAEIRAEIASLKQEIEVLNRLTTSDNLKLFFIEAEKKALLDPSTRNFATVRTTYGVFFVSVRETRPKADGTIVVLEIGNQSTAKFSDSVLTIGYNTRQPQKMTLEQSEEWGAQGKNIKHTLTSELLGATWNKVEVDLPGMPPDKLGYLEIEMQPGTVYLSNMK